MQSSLDDVLRWFAGIGEKRYLASWLAHNSVNRLRNDPEYGLKMFLFGYAYERSGAPRGYKIAAIRAVSAAWPNINEACARYREFYLGKKHEAANPLFDPRLEKINVPAIIKFVEQGDLATAFDKLSINGVGHKIKSFFLRDLVALTESEDRLRDRSSYLYCQPIDVWIRFTVDELNPQLPAAEIAIDHSKLGLSRVDADRAMKLTDAALKAGASPLKVNQGIWYFCENAVGDRGRLTDLLQVGNIETLDHELHLMDGSLP